MSAKSFFVDWELRERIRREALARRDALSPELRSAQSKSIAALVLNLQQFQAARTIHVYLSIRSEVDTAAIITAAIEQKKRVAIPRVYDKEMGAVEYSTITHFVPSTFGTLEPEDGVRVAPEEIEVVLVPLAAIDKNGNRLGYGKGHYDGFLSNARNALKIGLAFSLQEVRSMPVRSEDIRLDFVVTEEGVKEFS